MMGECQPEKQQEKQQDKVTGEVTGEVGSEKDLEGQARDHDGLEGPAGQDEPGLLKEELAREKSKAEENYNLLLRIQADFDNFRKRTLKEKEDIRGFATESLLTLLLPVLDNFQRALQSPPGNSQEFAAGVKMIYRQLMEVLENEGLEVIDALGEEFDPNLHEAVMQEEGSGQPDNTVSEELRRGYLFKGRLIRPAMVKVARSS